MEPRGKAGSALESSAPGTPCVAMRKWQNAFPTFGSYDKYLVKHEYRSFMYCMYCMKLQNIPCEGLRGRKAEAGRNETKKQQAWERKRTSSK